ncbi:MAG TPA: SIMPL domain-containing protein, partial [Verrucomicrobiae bacterium]|nr:SIMPL domain-containing protein [Verrucomicrobiae bacterium]
KWAGDLAKVEAFLKGRNITNYVLDSVSATEVKSRPTREDGEVKTVGYALCQNVQFTTTNAALVATIGLDSAQLVRQGVLFTSRNPDFLYTKVAEDKITMLADATKDARIRAGQISRQGGRTLGELRSARMGIFQITARYSSETSAEGVNDLSSNEKTIHAVVSASFSLK